MLCTALPVLAHDSLLAKNLEKDVEDGIIRIYDSTDKQAFIAYDKQGDCRPETRERLEMLVLDCRQMAVNYIAGHGIKRRTN